MRPSLVLRVAIALAAIATTPATAAQSSDVIPASLLEADPSDTTLEQSALARGDITSFDILGYRLGMAPREVLRVSKKRGVFSYGAPITTGSFEVEATRIANRSLNRTVNRSSKVQLAGTMGQMENGSTFVFTFGLEPTGPKLSSLKYSTNRNGQTKDAIMASLVAKYGPYTYDRDYAVFWCKPTKHDCDYGSAHMTAQIDDQKLTISITRPKSYTTELQQQLEKRAAAIAAQQGGKVAF
ncbi:hypothetical protein [Sphingosinicella sp. BN140058]|uniref:hypothetical protein n=1 Tax=Sphingosinicella sp. BN140058 TaxID=1892855 RepID=UPI001012ADEF|nr:hypothetical protein [Sphingosinicella sp. BN140058]QAY80244.1 hypothetical protein ETR14_26740 [Sphingosinicella sp. BN140058]